MFRSIKTLSLLTVMSVLAGCASAPHNPDDPLENFNRSVFKFNDAMDRAALKPAAKAYKTALPTFIQTGVSNFFSNLGDIPVSLNNFLQGKVVDGSSDILRVAVNSTVGLFGLIDWGSDLGLNKHKADFGQTLGKWGVGSGAYVVLPFFGPSNLRDGLSLPIEFKTDPWLYKEPVRWRNVGSAMRVVERRAEFLSADTVLEEAALDKYTFVRDAYRQHRQSRIDAGDGSLPQTKDDTAPERQEETEGDQGQPKNTLGSDAGRTGSSPQTTVGDQGKNSNSVMPYPLMSPRSEQTGASARSLVDVREKR